MFTRLKALGGNLVVYGIGDAATQIISFFLLPIYVRYLSPADYGVLALLLTVEVATKVLFRWGIDASFMGVASRTTVRLLLVCLLAAIGALGLRYRRLMAFAK